MWLLKRNTTWMNLCGDINVCLLCKTRFLFTKFTKAKYYQRHCLWNVSFFLWILRTKNFRNVSVKYIELQRFPVFTAFLSRIFVTIIIIIFVFSLTFRCYLHILQNATTILLHWNIEFAYRSIPCCFLSDFACWTLGT